MRQQLLKAELVMGPHADILSPLAMHQEMTEPVSDPKCTSKTAHASMGVQV